jgi:hypothetical protein
VPYSCLDEQTPNFAMHSDDVHENADPNTRMYTAHIIQHNENEHLPLPSNSVPSTRLNIPDPVSPQFPPDMLFDCVYAGMVLCHFGTETMKDGITAKWKHLFYPDFNGPTTRANADRMTVLDECAAPPAKREQQVQERDTRHGHRSGAHHNAFDFDLLAIPYLLVPPEELQAMLKAAEEEAEAAEQKRVRDKVGEWARQINTTESP